MTRRQRLGQHFLEPAWAARLIEAVQPMPEDLILEIGPGRGALTIGLAPLVERLVAVEIDPSLATGLVPTLPRNAEVVCADFLKVDLGSLFSPSDRPLRVVGNLPYSASSPILFRLLAAHDEGRRIREAIVMLQREVADRLVATVGGADYGVLTLQTALHADVDRLFTVPPGAFRPSPKVFSAVVRMKFRSPTVDVGETTAFERTVRGVFLHRRKTLRNALGSVLGSAEKADRVLDRAEIAHERRPQTLTLEEAARLSRTVLYFPGSY